MKIFNMEVTLSTKCCSGLLKCMNLFSVRMFGCNWGHMKCKFTNVLNVFVSMVKLDSLARLYSSTILGAVDSKR